MTADPNKDLYEKTMALLKPVLTRVASDAAFRERLERSPLEVIDQLGVELDADTRSELEGKRFSEFWAARRRTVEGPMEIQIRHPTRARSKIGSLTRCGRSQCRAPTSHRS